VVVSEKESLPPYSYSCPSYVVCGLAPCLVPEITVLWIDLGFGLLFCLCMILAGLVVGLIAVRAMLCWPASGAVGLCPVSEGIAIMVVLRSKLAFH